MTVNDEQVPALHKCGYRIEPDQDGENALDLVVKLPDDTTHRKRIYTGKPNEMAVAHTARAQDLLEAMCRFANAWTEEDEVNPYELGIDELADRFYELLPNMPQVTIDPAWKLYLYFGDTHERVFHKDGEDLYYRIVDDEFTEELTWAQLLELEDGNRIIMDNSSDAII